MSGYSTTFGKCITGDSIDVLNTLEDNSINLIVTSPPFSNQRKKKYANFDEVPQSEYVEWLLQFARSAYNKLAPDGSLVIDIRSAYEKGKAVESIYPYEFLIRMVKDLNYKFCQNVYWNNTSALPLPIQYVNIEKIRLKNSLNMNMWFTKADDGRCKANNKNVLVPYSSRMQSLIDKPENFIKGDQVTRPSGNVLTTKSWQKDNGGAIPSNLLSYPNSASNDSYLRYCKALNIKAHPARYPYKLIEFWVKFLTEEGDLVVDIFGGSNTTGKVAEDLCRRWMSIDISPEYVASSIFRFCDNLDQATDYYNRIVAGEEIDLK
ncbi:MAG: site-specific DNA-methyltransferase [Lachnospiraceae bacterium]|uniref:DNA-methyltransferase n=1 Tax=Mogibacterium sp. TaxID=2049035 RepID=UPI0025874C69|nr:site-specific DNA-methyltransferase [Mogibacterium sp.]MCI5740636.1 site-specific DNA-methyltransferase [Lachnospiraceae bacterium]MCI7123416.1 site-specific DNA-methyltransferase [Mogibacterium sp.]